MTLTRIFLVPLVGAAIALSPGSARANERDLIGALLGATALYVIVDGISDRDKGHRPSVVQPRSRHGDVAHPQALRAHPGFRDASPGRSGVQRRAQAVPQHCVRREETRHGSRLVVSERCVARSRSQPQRGTHR